MDVARGLFQQDASDDEASMDQGNDLQGSPSPISRQDYAGIIHDMCIPTPVTRTIEEEIESVRACANGSQRFWKMVRPDPGRYGVTSDMFTSRWKCTQCGETRRTWNPSTTLDPTEEKKPPLERTGTPRKYAIFLRTYMSHT